MRQHTRAFRLLQFSQATIARGALLRFGRPLLCSPGNSAVIVSATEALLSVSLGFILAILEQKIHSKVGSRKAREVEH